MAQVIAVATGKGGCGKTTTSLALVYAAASMGRRVLIVDLDPMGGAVPALGLPRPRATIADVFAGKAKVGDAISTHPTLPISCLWGDRRLEDLGATREALARRQGRLKETLAQIPASIDDVVLDTQPDGPALEAPLQLADRVAVPALLDRLSMRGAVMTAALAESLGVLDKVMGIVLSNVPSGHDPALGRVPRLTRRREKLLVALTVEHPQLADTRVAFHSILWARDAWGEVLDGVSPRGEALDHARALFVELGGRERAPLVGWRILRRLATDPAFLPQGESHRHELGEHRVGASAAVTARGEWPGL